MTNNKKIVLASMAVIVAVGLLVLNPSIIGNAQAQGYNSEYGYDNYYPQEKSSHVEVQKILCLNDNKNINGIDITQIPQDGTATAAAANEEGSEDGAANTQNGNGLLDRINFDRNLVNICVNVNFNEQESNGQDSCQGCFRENLDEQELQALEDELATDPRFGSLDGLCEFLITGTESKEIKAETVLILLGQAGISQEDQERILECLDDLGLVEFPLPPP